MNNPSAWILLNALLASSANAGPSVQCTQPEFVGSGLNPRIYTDRTHSIFSPSRNLVYLDYDSHIVFQRLDGPGGIDLSTGESTKIKTYTKPTTSTEVMYEVFLDHVATQHTYLAILRSDTNLNERNQIVIQDLGISGRPDLANSKPIVIDRSLFPTSAQQPIMEYFTHLTVTAHHGPLSTGSMPFEPIVSWMVQGSEAWTSFPPSRQYVETRYCKISDCLKGVIKKIQNPVIMQSTMGIPMFNTIVPMPRFSINEPTLLSGVLTNFFLGPIAYEVHMLGTAWSNRWSVGLALGAAIENDFVFTKIVGSDTFDLETLGTAAGTHVYYSSKIPNYMKGFTENSIRVARREDGNGRLLFAVDRGTKTSQWIYYSVPFVASLKKVGDAFEIGTETPILFPEAGDYVVKDIDEDWITYSRYRGYNQSEIWINRCAVQ